MKLEDKLKTMNNKNKVKNSFNTISEKQDSQVKRTVLNFSQIDILYESFNILSMGLDYKITKEKLQLDISGIEHEIIK